MEALKLLRSQYGIARDSRESTTAGRNAAQNIAGGTTVWPADQCYLNGGAWMGGRPRIRVGASLEMYPKRRSLQLEHVDKDVPESR
jgi:hypothetical protein